MAKNIANKQEQYCIAILRKEGGGVRADGYCTSFFQEGLLVMKVATPGTSALMSQLF